LEKLISEKLEDRFGFPVPTIIRKATLIDTLLQEDSFAGQLLTKDMRWYISFLHQEVETNLSLPWTSDDGSYRILRQRDKNILSVLDLSISQTPKAMDALEKMYGKGITTRNWKTIQRIEKKLADRR
jgi:uncharacterized protein (DUF1697 family)